MIAQPDIEARLAALERAVHGGSVVRGWSAAARVLGLSVTTIKKLHKLGRLPKPRAVNGRKDGMSPEWSLSSLINHKTQKQS